MDNAGFKKRLPLIAAMLALWCAGIGYNYFFNYVSSTDVTVEVVLRPSGEVITDLAEITAYETYFPEAGENIEPYQQYGPIFPTDDRPNVFHVENGIQAGFEASIGGGELGPIGTTGGIAEEYTLTLSTRDGLVRLNVETDGDAPEFFVQAASDPASGTFEARSQGVPEDGQMVFLLPEGEWTFSALDDGFDQTVVVAVPEGDIVEATLDLRAAD